MHTYNIYNDDEYLATIHLADSESCTRVIIIHITQSLQHHGAKILQHPPLLQFAGLRFVFGPERDPVR